VHVRLRADGADALVEVRDSGIGIAAEELPRIFELFAQGATDAARARGGMGIGLTLARKLVELHGGALRAASDGPGHGALFTVRLPLAPAPAAPAPSPAPPPAGGRLRLLLVEDNADARTSMARALELAGHEVCAVGNGAAALEAAIAACPAAALLDIGLPGMDGYELARRLRAASGRSVALVALTGYGREVDRRLAAAAGFDAHFTKPVDFERLLRTLDELTARGEPGSFSRAV
jgi:CheY-like chemotaxis protein